MSHLVVLGLDSREDAERVFDLTADLARQQLLQLQDVAYPYSPTIIQTNLTRTARRSSSRRCSRDARRTSRPLRLRSVVMPD